MVSVFNIYTFFFVQHKLIAKKKNRHYYLNNGEYREIFDLQMKSAACGYCTTPFTSDSLLINNPCPASSSSNFCPARFCNRLCLARSSKTHPLLCPVQNPASVPLIKYARESQWMALNALAHCTSRILLANQVGEETLNADWVIVKGLAVLGMEERILYSFSSYVIFILFSQREELLLF